MSSHLRFFDSHCHFDFDIFDSDRDALWSQCNRLGIRHMLIPGVAPDQWDIAQALAKGGIYYSVGVHPWWIDRVYLANLATYELAALEASLKESIAHHIASSRCVAIGECGLDKVIATPLTLQQRVLDFQLELASVYQKPVILHCRGSHNALIRSLKHFGLRSGGVIHAFSGSAELANTYWRLGLRLGIGGTITYARAKKTRAAVKQLPAAAIVLETDAPDMPLCGHQGQRNGPHHIPAIAKALAELRGESLECVADYCFANTLSLFNCDNTLV